MYCVYGTTTLKNIPNQKANEEKTYGRFKSTNVLEKYDKYENIWEMYYELNSSIIIEKIHTD